MPAPDEATAFVRKIMTQSPAGGPPATPPLASPQGWLSDFGNWLASAPSWWQTQMEHLTWPGAGQRPGPMTAPPGPPSGLRPGYGEEFRTLLPYVSGMVGPTGGGGGGFRGYLEEFMKNRPPANINEPLKAPMPGSKTVGDTLNQISEMLKGSQATRTAAKAQHEASRGPSPAGIAPGKSANVDQPAFPTQQQWDAYVYDTYQTLKDQLPSDQVMWHANKIKSDPNYMKVFVRFMDKTRYETGKTPNALQLKKFMAQQGWVPPSETPE